MVHSVCSCAKHTMPVDLVGVAINLIYHFVIWYSILYLWQDAKDTWVMIFGKQNMEGY
jgi:hypothetical protein